MQAFQLVVAGGGPSGSAAAYTAAMAGLQVCIIDKVEFPREKLCGGLLTQRSKIIYEKIFGGYWNEKIISPSSDVRFFQNSRFLSKQSDYSTLYFTMRRDFDLHLLELAKNAGASVLLGNPISSVNIDKRQLILKNGDVIFFDYLIGADGVNSVVAKELFGSSFNPHTIGFGLEVEVPRSDLQDRSDQIDIDFGAANWGYGWVFPKRDSFTIGVGGIHKLNPNLKDSLSTYLDSLGLVLEKYQVKGQYIPFGDFKLRPGSGRVMLCGDAAGFVDPITGEGIAYAMQSGAFAAEVIVDSTSHDDCDLISHYQSKIAPIYNSLQQARFWRQFIFAAWAKGLFSLLFADAGTLQRGYLDILAGKIEYQHLYGLLGLQARKALLKLLRVIPQKLTARRRRS